MGITKSLYGDLDKNCQLEIKKGKNVSYPQQLYSKYDIISIKYYFKIENLYSRNIRIHQRITMFCLGHFLAD